MQKMMFDDRCLLTYMVERGYKTQVRRKTYNRPSKYRIDEIVAVAKTYQELGYDEKWLMENVEPVPNTNRGEPIEKRYPGWVDKRYVVPELMDTFIHITGVRVEYLSAMRNGDSLKEGVRKLKMEKEMEGGGGKYVCDEYFIPNCDTRFDTAEEAFRILATYEIGADVWEKDWECYVYDFKVLPYFNPQ